MFSLLPKSLNDAIMQPSTFAHHFHSKQGMQNGEGNGPGHLRQGDIQRVQLKKFCGIRLLIHAE